MGIGKGAALHPDTNKAETATATLAAAATPKPQSNRQKLAAKAWDFAYHSNTKKSQLQKTQEERQGHPSGQSETRVQESAR